jgi:DNA-binding PadR family transcriptional regulator
MENEDFEGFGHWHGHMFRGMYGGAKRGDLTPIILQALTERPMHGYEIIRELEKKSHGFWRPSPGSVYPTLQMLEEQDLVKSKDSGGKKVYELTDAGRAEAEKSNTQGPWSWHGKHHDFEAGMAMRSAFFELVGSFKTVVRTGDQELQDKAIKIIKDAAKKLQELQDKK